MKVLYNKQIFTDNFEIKEIKKKWTKIFQKGQSEGEPWTLQDGFHPEETVLKTVHCYPRLGSSRICMEACLTALPRAGISDERMVSQILNKIFTNNLKVIQL